MYQFQHPVCGESSVYCLTGSNATHAMDRVLVMFQYYTAFCSSNTTIKDELTLKISQHFHSFQYAAVLCYSEDECFHYHNYSLFLKSKVTSSNGFLCLHTNTRKQSPIILCQSTIDCFSSTCTHKKKNCQVTYLLYAAYVCRKLH